MIHIESIFTVLFASVCLFGLVALLSLPLLKVYLRRP